MSLAAPSQLLQELIAHDSVSSNGTHAIATLLAERLQPHADELHLLACDEEDQVNLLARVGPAEDQSRAGVLLSGHLDVVPADEPDWQSPPFSPRVDQETARIFGRGASDMKASVACFVATLAGLDRQALRAPVWLLLSANEEVGSLGVQHFAQHHAKQFNLPNQCVVGEPTELRVVRMHKGHLKIRVRFMGAPAHTGTPDLGSNAIIPAAEVVASISALQARWRQIESPDGEFFASAPHPIANVVGIRGGTAWNVLPEMCEVDIGVRLLPGGSSQAAIAEIDQVCKRPVGGCESSVEVINDNPPLLTEADAPIHTLCCEIVGQRESLGVPFASDGGVLKRDLAIDCVLFGPGSMAVAHRANEHVAISQIDEYCHLIRALIDRACTGGRGVQNA